MKQILLLSLLLLTAPAIADDGDVKPLSAYRPCCGQCAYLRGCSDDPRIQGACCPAGVAGPAEDLDILDEGGHRDRGRGQSDRRSP